MLYYWPPLLYLLLLLLLLLLAAALALLLAAGRRCVAWCLVVTWCDWLPRYACWRRAAHSIATPFVLLPHSFGVAPRD